MNLRPLEPHSSALPDCATSRREDVDRRRQQACQQKHPVFLQTAPPAPCAEKGKNRITVCALRPSARYGRSAGTSRPQPCPAALPYPLDGAASRSLYGVRTCHRWLPCAKGHRSGWERYTLRSALCPPPAWSRPGARHTGKGLGLLPHKTEKGPTFP